MKSIVCSIRRNETLDVEAYEFYWPDSQENDHLIGILAERRKDPKKNHR